MPAATRPTDHDNTANRSTSVPSTGICSACGIGQSREHAAEEHQRRGDDEQAEAPEDDRMGPADDRFGEHPRLADHLREERPAAAAAVIEAVLRPPCAARVSDCAIRQTKDRHGGCQEDPQPDDPAESQGNRSRLAWHDSVDTPRW